MRKCVSVWACLWICVHNYILLNHISNYCDRLCDSYRPQHLSVLLFFCKNIYEPQEYIIEIEKILLS